MGAVDEYLATLDDGARSAYERIRDLALAEVPAAEQGTSYGMAALKYRGKPLLGFRAAKDHLSVFPFSSVAVEAVNEVGNPTILATFAVIAAVLPMAFVGGLMGPYMRPIPIGASAAMLFSLLVAFVVTPWAAVRLLRRRAAHAGEHEDRLTAIYRRTLDNFLRPT